MPYGGSVLVSRHRRDKVQGCVRCSKEIPARRGWAGRGRRIGPPTPYTLHLTPYTLHLTPYTVHPAPYTPHPTSYTLHATPHTLHPTPRTLGCRSAVIIDACNIQASCPSCSGCRVQGSGFRVQGSGFRVQGAGSPTQPQRSLTPQRAFCPSCQVSQKK